MSRIIRRVLCRDKPNRHDDELRAAGLTDDDFGEHVQFHPRGHTAVVDDKGGIHLLPAGHTAVERDDGVHVYRHGSHTRRRHSTIDGTNGNLQAGLRELNRQNEDYYKGGKQ